MSSTSRRWMRASGGLKKRWRKTRATLHPRDHVAGMCLVHLGPNVRADTLSRHWPLDLIELHSFISRPCLPSSSTASQPLRLLLHLTNPPNDRLLMPNTIESCKTQFVNQVRQADFVRWRNTNKVTNMRKPDLDAGWDGILQGMCSFSFMMKHE